MIANSAFRLFSSVFKKRLTAPSSSEDDNAGVQEGSIPEIPEEALENGAVAEPIAQDRDAIHVNRQKSEPELTELEQLLKNKTFSREEFNHLTELLQSRIVDSPSGLKEYEEKMRGELHGGVEPNNVANTEAQRWREERKKAREERENTVWNKSLLGNTSSPAVPPNPIPDDVGSSPADIAKAYMGVRPFRASSSALALQGKIFRDESAPNRLNDHALVPRTTEGWLVSNGQLEDRFKTPQMHKARSRIQSMTRTPYARNVHRQASVERVDDGFPSNTPSTHWTPMQSPLTGGRQVLKRRSSVLDDGFASVGPIRRTRQKSTNTPLKKSDLSGSSSGQLIPLLSPGYDAGQNGLSVTRRNTEREKHNDIYSAYQAKNDATKNVGASFAYVPPQSSETARKILEHLDRMVPSPKEKSTEAQLAIARNKSPSRLTVGMLNAHARRTTENIGASPLFDIHGTSSSPVQTHNESLGQGVSAADQRYAAKGKAPLVNSVAMPVEVPASSGIGDATFQSSDSVSVRVDANSAVLDIPSSAPEKKSKGFRMSALEVLQESDEEGHGGKKAPVLGNGETGKFKSIQSDGNDGNMNLLKANKPIQTLFGGSTQPKMGNTTPMYNFGTTTSKGPVFSFPTNGPIDVDTSKPKFDFKFESKPETSFSSTAVAAAAAATSASNPQGTLESESSALILKGSTSLSNSTSIFSTRTAVTAPAPGIPSFDGSVCKADGMNSSPFSSPALSSATTTATTNNCNLAMPGSIAQGAASAPATTDHLFKSFSSVDQNTSKSGNEITSNGLSPSRSLFGISSGTSSPLSDTAMVSNSASGLFLNSSGSAMGHALSSVPASSSAPFVFGSPASVSVLSSSSSATSLFSSGLSVTVGSTGSSLFGSGSTPLGGSSASFGSGSTPLFGGSNASFGSGSTPSFGGSSASFGSGSTKSFGGSSAAFGSGSTPSLAGSSSTLSSGSCPSFGVSSASFSSGSTPAFVGSSASFGSGSNLLIGGSSASFGSGSAPLFGGSSASFGSGSAPSFGGSSALCSSGSTPALGGSSVSFGSGSTPSLGGSSASFGSGSAPLFGGSSASFGTGIAPSFGGSSASSSSGSAPSFSGSSTSFGLGSAPLFGGSSALSSSGSAPSFSGSSASFGSGSSPSLGGSSSSFGSGSTPLFGGSSASFGLGSSPSFGASSAAFGSASTLSFGLTPPFGASSAASSQTTTPSFGSGFGGSSSLPSAGFSFGGSVAANTPSFQFGTSGSTSSASTFSFTAPTGASPSTFTFGSKESSPASQQSMFGLTSSTPFGVPTSPAANDQMNMEDSMAEDPAQVSNPAPSVFGQPASSASPFLFGSQSNAASTGQPVFQFGAQTGVANPNPFAAGAQSTFTPTSATLEFSGGGFSLGTGGEKSGRKFIKAKRDKSRRK